MIGLPTCFRFVGQREINLHFILQLLQNTSGLATGDISSSFSCFRRPEVSLLAAADISSLNFFRIYHDLAPFEVRVSGGHGPDKKDNDVGTICSNILELLWYGLHNFHDGCLRSW